MKKIMAICIGIIIFLSGCSKATTENDELITDGTVTDVPEIYSENDNTEDVSHEHTDTEVKISIDDILKELENNGYTVICESVEPQILTGKRHLLTFSGVSDGRITIYEYDNSAQAQVDVYSIDDSGSEVVLENETHYVEWKSIPHFYLYNNLIIQHIGTDRDILNLLTNLCGNQFAGGDK